MNAILTKWEQVGYSEAAVGLREAPKGAATGTEGLMMMIEYLTEMEHSEPKVIDAVQNELNELIEFCLSDGILVNETWSKRSSLHSGRYPPS